MASPLPRFRYFPPTVYFNCANYTAKLTRGTFAAEIIYQLWQGIGHRTFWCSKLLSLQSSADSLAQTGTGCRQDRQQDKSTFLCLMLFSCDYLQLAISFASVLACLDFTA